MLQVTIKELHRITGEVVRRAGKSRVPIVVTDRGKPVAVIGSPLLIKRKKVKRVLLPEFAAMMKAGPMTNDVLEDLDAIRGDR